MNIFKDLMKWFPVWGHLFALCVFLVSGEWATAWFCFAATWFAFDATYQRHVSAS